MSSERQDDARLTLRGSLGPSASAKLATHDRDNDGMSNFQIDVDYGFGGVTIETEKPLVTASQLARAVMSPLTALPELLLSRYYRP